MFWKSVPKENWPSDEACLEFIQKRRVESFGDMQQELVFIGQDLDKPQMIVALDNCLLSEEELLKGKQYWQTLADPFPVWRGTNAA